MRNGYFYGSLYNESLNFDAEVVEGWNFISFSLFKDVASTYTRMRLTAYSRDKMTLSYLTFSNLFYDDPMYDLIVGAKYSNDGLDITKGFSGYILEIRIYSTSLMTLDQLDQ